jgi:hypothetical protein
MRRFISLCSIALLASTAILNTAVAQQERDAVEVLLAQIQADRQAVVAENMLFEAAESEAFWPLYREYRANMSELADQRVQMIIRYRDTYDSLTDEIANELLNEYFDAEKERSKIRQKYAKQFSKAIGDKKTFRFFQIENKIDTVINFDLALTIPLAK